MGRAEERAYEAAVLAKNYAKARQVSWNVEDVQESSKAARLVELVDAAEEDGRKVIVFSFFLDTIRKVTELLGPRCTPPINGSIPPQRRQEIIDEFDGAPAGTVLAAQIQSGGTGLNIQSASVVLLCEPQFKPSIEQQAIARAYRMGQTRNVLVYRLLCEGTVDEKIMSTLESKQAIFDAFADQSVAGLESLELDERTFGDIIQEEIDRIKAKREAEEGAEPPTDPESPEDTDGPAEPEAPEDTDGPAEPEAPEDTDNPAEPEAPEDTEDPADPEGPEDTDGPAEPESEAPEDTDETDKKEG